MSDDRHVNPVSEHATAIVVGGTGLLFVGASGAGKSTAAFACLQNASMRGWHAALIADDRTVLSPRGNRLVASCPETLKGLIEVRGAGILRVRWRDTAVMHLAVRLDESSPATRLPPDHDTFARHGLELPLAHLWRNGAADPLATLCALRPDCFLSN